MSTLALKSSIHKIIDNIENELLLQTQYDFLRMKEKSETGKLWSSLTQEQKNEVLNAFDESEDENNLIDSSAIFKLVK
jgi:hypothetical protein